MQPKQILSFCDLEALLPFTTDRDRLAYLPLLNEVCSKFQINTPSRISLFFAQLEILSSEFKNIAEVNINIISNFPDISEPSVANVFYPFAFLWATRDCNPNADVGMVGLVTKKLCDSYDKSAEKLRTYHRNKLYFK